MVATGISPDFISVDGGEGGTGAAPIEFTNSVGMPLREGLLAVHNTLVGFGLRDTVRVVASGKIVTGFHIVRAIALGADLCNSSRAMMLAIGCIQARRCNANDCPVGVATTDPKLAKALVPRDKAIRVARFQRESIHVLLELVGAAGLERPEHIEPKHIYRRVAHNQIATFAEIYDYLSPGVLLHAENVPETWRSDWHRASPQSFA